jgi:hypothetical protein
VLLRYDTSRCTVFVTLNPATTDLLRIHSFDGVGGRLGYVLNIGIDYLVLVEVADSAFIVVGAHLGIILWGDIVMTCSTIFCLLVRIRSLS